MTKSVFTRAYGVFVECLIEARKSAGMTQQEVADGLGRPQSFVAKYENQERRLDVVEFLAIAQIMKIDPTKIIGKVKAELP